jgi:hypothetical protein
MRCAQVHTGACVCVCVFVYMCVLAGAQTRIHTDTHTRAHTHTHTAPTHFLPTHSLKLPAAHCSSRSPSTQAHFLYIYIYIYILVLIDAFICYVLYLFICCFTRRKLLYPHCFFFTFFRCIFCFTLNTGTNRFAV